jgi:hypothetical protein
MLGNAIKASNTFTFFYFYPKILKVGATRCVDFSFGRQGGF